MPWLVVIFGLLIVPLSVTSISFIIIQPILLGTWSTLTLIGVAAMLLQPGFARWLCLFLVLEANFPSISRACRV
jgi:hypothetical protein